MLACQRTPLKREKYTFLLAPHFPVISNCDVTNTTPLGLKNHLTICLLPKVQQSISFNEMLIQSIFAGSHKQRASREEMRGPPKIKEQKIKIWNMGLLKHDWKTCSAQRFHRKSAVTLVLFIGPPSTCNLPVSNLFYLTACFHSLNTLQWPHFFNHAVWDL